MKNKKTLYRILIISAISIAICVGMVFAYNAIRRKYYPTVDELFSSNMPNVFASNHVTPQRLVDANFIDVSAPLPSNNERLVALIDGVAKKERKTAGVFRKDTNGNLIVGFAMSNENIVEEPMYVEYSDNFNRYSRYTIENIYTTEKDGIISVHLKVNGDRPDIMLYSYKK